MLPGLAKRSHDSPWHLGHRRGGVTTPSGSKPQDRHWIWKTVTRCRLAGKGLYLRNCPSEAKRSMLIDIPNTPSCKVLHPFFGCEAGVTFAKAIPPASALSELGVSERIYSRKLVASGWCPDVCGDLGMWGE